MTYFPNSIMPKDLRKETQNEVDDSPAIYNARDYNRHHREILAIEKFLLSHGIKDAIKQIKDLLDDIQNGTGLVQSEGELNNTETVPIPTGIVSTTIQGPLAPGDTTITLASTADWPTTGYLTKFNSNLTSLYCTAGGVPPCASPSLAFYDYENQVASITNEEIMSYEVTSDTQLTVTRGLFGTTAQDVPAPRRYKIVCGVAHITYSWASWSATQPQVSEIYAEADARLISSMHVRALGNTTSSGLLDASSVPMKVRYNLYIMKNFEVPGNI